MLLFYRHTVCITNAKVRPLYLREQCLFTCGWVDSHATPSPKRQVTALPPSVGGSTGGREKDTSTKGVVAGFMMELLLTTHLPSLIVTLKAQHYTHETIMPSVNQRHSFHLLSLRCTVKYFVSSSNFFTFNSAHPKFIFIIINSNISHPWFNS